MAMTLTTAARHAAVRLRVGVADVGGRVDAAVQRRRQTLEDQGERGAQVAEYAMLGGVGAAACSALVAIFKNRETLKTLIDAIIAALGKVVEGWF